MRPPAPRSPVMAALRALEAEEARKGKSRVPKPGHMLSDAESAAAIRLLKQQPPLSKARKAKKVAEQAAPAKKRLARGKGAK